MIFTQLKSIILIIGMIAGSAVIVSGQVNTKCNKQGNNVVCRDESVENIKTFLGRQTNVEKLTLYYKVSTNLPAGLTAGTVSLKNFEIGCVDGNRKLTNPVLKVDPGAFSQSKSVAESFNIVGCDLKQLDLRFLTGFTKLHTLTIDNSANFPTSFQTLPSASLTSLSSLTLTALSDTSDFTSSTFNYPKLLKNGQLKNLYISGIVYPNSETDVIIQNFLEKWITPISVDSLTYLGLPLNSLSKIPADVAKFNNLDTADLYQNTKPLEIQSGVFSKNKLRALNLYQNEISSIQSDAISFKQKGATLNLYQSAIKLIQSNAIQFMEMSSTLNLYQSEIVSFQSNAISFKGVDSTLNLYQSGIGSIEYGALSFNEAVATLNLYQSGIDSLQSGAISFKGVDSTLNLYQSTINLTQSGAITCLKGSATLNMYQSKFASIQPGAFSGNYGSSTINIYDNGLTELNSSIFLPILKTMEAAGSGEINAYNNPIDCSRTKICGLAWMVRDNPSFLNYVNAHCSDWTYFSQLNRNSFTNCKKIQ